MTACPSCDLIHTRSETEAGVCVRTGCGATLPQRARPPTRAEEQARARANWLRFDEADYVTGLEIALKKHAALGLTVFCLATLHTNLERATAQGNLIFAALGGAGVLALVHVFANKGARTPSPALNLLVFLLGSGAWLATVYWVQFSGSG